MDAWASSWKRIRSISRGPAIRNVNRPLVASLASRAFGSSSLLTLRRSVEDFV